VTLVASISLSVVPYVVTVYSICVFVYQYVPTDAYTRQVSTMEGIAKQKTTPNVMGGESACYLLSSAFSKSLNNLHSLHLEKIKLMLDYISVKCNGAQENAVPLPPIYGSKLPTPQIVIMLVIGTRPLSWART